MNIVFLVGNGFDLNLGMKTKYSDFYKHYRSVTSENVLIKELKKSISSDSYNWSDLELALGRHTEHLSHQDDFDVVFEDIGTHLSDYLEQQERMFNFSEIDVKKFFDDLSHPEQFLPSADRSRINKFRQRWQNSPWKVHIVTFNYTRTIEKLIGEEIANIRIGTHDARPIFLKGIEHIHGYTNERRVMGVNDIFQIKNSEFHKNEDVIEALVKPSCNEALRHTIDTECINKISSANLICIFGSSIGDTDKFWWSLIGKQLQRDCILIIFNRGEDIHPSLQYKISREERTLKKYFLSQAGFDKNIGHEESNKIFVGLNTNMFKPTYSS